MKKVFFLTTIITFISILFLACGDGTVQTQEAKEEVVEAVSDTKDAIEAERDALQEDLLTMKTKIDNKIKDLQSDFGTIV